MVAFKGLEKGLNMPRKGTYKRQKQEGKTCEVVWLDQEDQADFRWLEAHWRCDRVEVLRRALRFATNELVARAVRAEDENADV